jgi:predicted DNA-binding transcriptional regulator
MSKDQMYGAVILLVSVVGLVVYAGLLYVYPVVILQITAFVAVALVLVILGWIGWTMATTPPPAPLETEPIPAELPTATAKDPEQQQT